MRATPAVTADPREALVLPPLCEWESRVFEGVALTPTSRAHAARLAEGREPRLQIDELRDGLRVRARSWVGVVRLDGLEIRIVPKLAGEQLGLVRLLEQVSGLDGLARLAGEAGLHLAGDNLLDLVALLFAEACEGVLRRGLLAGYVEREEDLPVVRGRILADRQVLRRFGRLDQIVCRFDELEHDLDENRLLAVTLRVAHRRVSAPAVRRRLARLRAILDPICDLTQLDLQTVRTELAYNRLNTHYEQAHALAWLLLDGLGVEDLLVPGETRGFAFLLDMNLLFERFVERIVRRVLPAEEFRVRYQASHGSILWNATAQRPYAHVIPDLLVEERSRRDARLAIDAKYKLYDERRLDPSDVYQTFLYAYGLGARAEGRPPAALILYPASGEELRRVGLQIRSPLGFPGAEVHALAIPIPAALDELEKDEPGAVLNALARIVRELTGGS